MFRKGSKIWYHPIINEPERYPGVMTTDLWALGDGTMVCHLDITGYDRPRINAACEQALEIRDSDEKAQLG